MNERINCEDLLKKLYNISDEWDLVLDKVGQLLCNEIIFEKDTYNLVYKNTFRSFKTDKNNIKIDVIEECLGDIVKDKTILIYDREKINNIIKLCRFNNKDCNISNIIVSPIYIKDKLHGFVVACNINEINRNEIVFKGISSILSKTLEKQYNNVLYKHKEVKNGIYNRNEFISKFYYLMNCSNKDKVGIVIINLNVLSNTYNKFGYSYVDKLMTSVVRMLLNMWGKYEIYINRVWI